ncbi:MAG TPA: helicase-related protein, partial [Candidatus Micrarchaeota archaeon]|nr:helicase-related protein [Candidatus Micrarchaeota archaeon]
TKPLARQHYQRILEDLDIPKEEVALVSGEVNPNDRKALWARKITVSTPQTLKNDIESGRVGFDYALCIFDEAHRTVGKYAYTYLANLARENGAVSLALTASPGSDMKKIVPIVETLGTKNVQIRTEEDLDVAPFVQKTNIEYVRVELGADLTKAKMALDKVSGEYTRTLAKMGFPITFKSKRALLDMRERIMKSNSHLKFSAMSYFTTLFNIAHATELLETQGVSTFLGYMEKLHGREGESKGILRITSNKDIQGVVEFLKTQAEHPKLAKLVEILKGKQGTKSIVFVQYRDQIALIVGHLNACGFRSERFVGKRDGVTQKIQAETIDRFRRGEFDILVASSIGEEGLDIPSVDNVIFFEPIGSEIRSIQRRGRAGRAKAGNIYVLITKNTKDEGYFYASRAKERRMRNIVYGMQEGGVEGWKKKRNYFKPVLQTTEAMLVGQEGAFQPENAVSAHEIPLEQSTSGQEGHHAKKKLPRKGESEQSRITDF